MTISETLSIFQRRIRQALAKLPVQDEGNEVVLLTPFETPNHETISIHLRRSGEFFELADGGTLNAHYLAARSELDKAPRGFERLLRFYDCEIRDGEVVKATKPDDMVWDATEFLMALNALAALTTTLASRSSNPFPSDVRKALQERGYGVGPGRLEVSNLILRYDVEYPAQNTAMLCVGGPLARVAEPEQEVHQAIERLLTLEKFTNKRTLLVVDEQNDWWTAYNQPLRKVKSNPVFAGEPLYAVLGEPDGVPREATAD